MKKPRRYARIPIFLLIILVTLLLLVPVFWGAGYIVDFLTVYAMFVVLVVSLHLPMRLGLVSFAHLAFMAIGAYTSALLTMQLGFSFWSALPVSALAGAVIALAIGYPILRLKGPYFFLVTFAFNGVVMTAITFAKHFTGGYEGLANIPLPSATFASPAPFYYLALGLAAVTIAVAYRVDNSRIGIEWNAIEHSEDLAESMGINSTRNKLVAFVLSCFFAALIGSVYAHYTRTITPETFGLAVMFNVLIYVVVGGRYSTWGPVIGVLVLRALGELVGGLKQYEVVLNTSILVIVIMFLPGGIVGLIPLVKRLLKWSISHSAT